MRLPEPWGVNQDKTLGYHRAKWSREMAETNQAMERLLPETSWSLRYRRPAGPWGKRTLKKRETKDLEKQAEGERKNAKSLEVSCRIFWVMESAWVCVRGQRPREHTPDGGLALDFQGATEEPWAGWGAPGSCIPETRYLGVAAFTLIQVGEARLESPLLILSTLSPDAVVSRDNH